MNELALFKGCELAEPKLPDVFDYDASVLRMQDLRDKTGEGFKKLMEELWIARECLAVRTGRPRKVKAKGPKARSWMEYLDAVGLARSSVHKWLTDVFPDRDREITLPTPKLPPKSSTPERDMTPKEAATGLKDQALGNAMEKPEWNGNGPKPDNALDPDSSGEEREGLCPMPVAQVHGMIRERLIVLKVKINRLADVEKVRAAQKLLSELFELFSAE